MAIRNARMFGFFLAMMSGLCAIAAQADQIVTYKLNSGAGNGSFSWDFTTMTLASFSMSVGAGNYNLATSNVEVTLDSIHADYMGGDNNNYEFAMAFDRPLTATSGSSMTINPAKSYMTVWGPGFVLTRAPITSGGFITGSANAATYLTIQNSNAVPGSTVKITAKLSFPTAAVEESPAGKPIELFVDGRYVETSTGTDFLGNISIPFTVSTKASIGQHTIGLYSPPTTLFSGYFAAGALNVYRKTEISGFTPETGRIASLVKIMGQGFTGASEVSIGELNLTPSSYNYKVVDDYEIDFSVPADSSFKSNLPSGQITVKAPGGAAVSVNSFQGVPGPTLNSFYPAFGATVAPSSNNTTVLLVGGGFTGATSVKFGSLEALKFSVPIDGQINAQLPIGAVTGPITVTTPTGSSTCTTWFVVLPTITKVTVVPATLTGGQSATGTVYLATPAAEGGLQVALQLNNADPEAPVVASAPSSVTVPAGEKSVSFTITTKGVTSRQLLGVVAYIEHCGNDAASSSITINPAVANRQTVDRLCKLVESSI